MLSKWFCISINTHPFSQKTKQNKTMKYSHKLKIQQYCERTFTQFSSVLQRRWAARFYPPPTLTSNRWTAPSCSFLASTWAWETQGASYWVHRYLCYFDLKHIWIQMLHSKRRVTLCDMCLSLQQVNTSFFQQKGPFKFGQRRLRKRRRSLLLQVKQLRWSQQSISAADNLTQ